MPLAGTLASKTKRMSGKIPATNFIAVSRRRPVTVLRRPARMLPARRDPRPRKVKSEGEQAAHEQITCTISAASST
jgi:hypothetical protein